MFFLIGEYDAGASLHLSTCTNKPTCRCAMEKGRGVDPPIFKFEMILYGFLWCKDVNARPCLCTGSGWGCFKWLSVAGPNRSHV